MMTCAPMSVFGFNNTGFISVCGSRKHAAACTACARPISPPSTVTALFSAIFCGLNGATRIWRRTNARQIPVTSVLLPASEVVPCTMRVFVMPDSNPFLDPQELERYSAERFQSALFSLIPYRLSL
jgi:hypothetical protein